MKRIFSAAVLLFLPLFTSCTKGFSSTEKITEILLLSETKGIFRSTDNGSSWKSFNSGLPDNVLPLSCVESGENIILATQAHGLFRLNKESRSWSNISSPEFRRRSLYRKNTGYRRISALTCDPLNSLHLVTATKHTIYESTDGGVSWHEIITGNGFRAQYVTALAVLEKKIYAGTSYGGVFRLNGKTAEPVSGGLPFEPYSDTLKFYEEISSLAVAEDGSLAAALLHTDQVFVFTGVEWIKVNPDIPGNLKYRTSVSTWNRKITINNGDLYYLRDKKAIKSGTDYQGYLNDLPCGSNAAFFSDRNTGSFMVYLKINNISDTDCIKSLYAGQPKINRIENLCNVADRCGMNGLVIDMKDDEGRVLFPTTNGAAKEAGAVVRSVDIKEILSLIHSRKMKAIARIVVFKDRKLFRSGNGQYAIRDRITGRSWQGTDKEYWVDPCSEKVQAYNIDIACELEKKGFDEIQFDYIRFPSDGDTSRCDFQLMKKDGFYKSEVIEDFLSLARSRIKIPVSVDIYGFNAWYRFGNTIGQDMEEMSFIVDSICPMVYPSHFGNRFLKKGDAAQRTYSIIYESCRRGTVYTINRCRIRPYLQAFRLLSPDWGPGYITNQLRGAADGGASGYTFWHAAGEYDIVYKALAR